MLPYVIILKTNIIKCGSMQIIIGIDPGKTGGISVIDSELNLIATHPMPLTLKQPGAKQQVCPRALHSIMAPYGASLIVIEQVGARPGQGVTSMFSFGQAYGIASAIAELCSERVIYARPQAWRGSQLLTGASKAQVAQVAYDTFHAEGIFGRLSAKTGKRAIKDGISDALMIAKHGLKFLD